MTADLLPETPPPDAVGGSLALDMENAESLMFLVCRECYGDGRPFRFCARCGQETPQEELRVGRCAWCRAAEDIPFEEPDDDEWWQGKTPGTSAPSWWPRA
jgi:hypothetical protein